MIFPVLGEPSASVEPRDGSLDDPALPTFGFLAPVAATSDQDFDKSAVILDAFAGYNQQLTTSVLLGVEAEIGFTPHARRASVGIPGANGLFPIFGPPPVDPGNDFVSVNTPWSGSVRGRVGYLMTPDSMV